MRPGQDTAPLRNLSQSDLVRLQCLSEISQTLNSTYDLETVLGRALERVVEALGAQRGVILFWTPDDDQAHKEFRAKNDQGGFDHESFTFSQTAIDRALEEGQPLLLLDAAGSQREAASESMVFSGVRSVMAVPMRTRERTVGLIYLDNFIQAGVFREIELQILTILADLLVACIERTRYHAGLEESNRETILRLSLAAEYRDNETSAHIQRVGEYSACLARALGWDDEQIDTIRLASLMHDVGKLGIDDELLLNPNRYTDEEFRRMQRHTTIGSKILGGSNSSIVQMAERIAFTHHERWNGRGYPRGLAGDEIPIEGRIVALADVFDALVSQRRYKKAFTVREAIELLKRERGQHFDPSLVDLFLANLEEILAIRQRYLDEA